MFGELLEIIKIGLKKVLTSRLFVLTIVVLGMSSVLVYRLFDLQIVNGEDYQEEYVETTLTTISTDGTRGNIYDRNGVLLAYNELTYSVTVGDSGIYENGYQKNEMLLVLIDLLDEMGETIESSLYITIDDSGSFVYTTSSDSALLGFLRDVYGLSSTSELDDEDGEYPSDITAEELFLLLCDRYGVGTYEDGTTYEIDNETALKLINIRYSMAQNAYRKYDTVTVASDVSLETVAAVMENADTLQDVNIEEEYIRVYNDSYAFSHIIGYTGIADSDELAELQAEDDSYESGDVVGKTGIEAAYELELSGTKGSQTMYLDSEGRIIEIVETVDAEAGNDIYLTIDRDLQVGIYTILEQNLAGILVSKIINVDSYDVESVDDAADIEIPIKDVYFQFINNNLISMSDMAAEDASALEQSVYARFEERLAAALAELEEHMTTASAPIFSSCDDDIQDYQDQVYTYMRESGLLPDDLLDTSDEYYIAWTEETISLYDFLYHILEEGWIDTTLLTSADKYTSFDETYAELVAAIIEGLSEDSDFHKLVYKYMIEDEVVSGCEMCLLLFEQGVLEYDEADYASLASGGKTTAYNFVIEKISNLELTPAQLALDPCSASCVLTDVQTGEVLALVSYPGYDINSFSGSIDVDYYYELYNDLSQPFLNRATQVETAPGSTFKPLIMAMGLEEGVITASEEVDDTGVFTKLDLNLHCWNTSGHGLISSITAIAQSCNYYFSEIGYRVSLDEDGEYVASLGLETIAEYAEMFGFGSKSGVEISESSPNITDENPVPSAIGQGSNAYAAIHLSRYVTAIASEGNLYTYSLLSKIATSDGEVTYEYETTIESYIEFSDSTWDVVREGMWSVVNSSLGTYGSIFSDSEVANTYGFSGKSGTAEESETRANHALFISYSPAATGDTYEDVEAEISLVVVIPYGYGASNAAQITEEIYSLYYGITDLDELLSSNKAADNDSTYIAD